MFGWDTRSAVVNLILINLLFFAAKFFAGAAGIDLDRMLGLYYPDSPWFRPFQLVTHMFMHGSLLHIFSNMYALYLFGMLLERVWGSQRFLLFYFVTGMGAVVLHLGVMAIEVYNYTGSVMASEADLMRFPGLQLIYHVPTVGASGAVFGILAAFGMLFPNTELMLLFLPIPIRAKYFVTFYMAWELYRGFAYDPSDNVAHFAHLGGALFGFLLVKYWNRRRDFLF